MSLSSFIIVIVLVMIGLFSLTAINSALRRLQKKDAKKKLHSLGKRFFYRYLHHAFFTNQESEGLLFAITGAQNVLRFLYAILSILILLYTKIIEFDPTSTSVVLVNWPMGILYLVGLFLIFFIFGDYIPRVLSNRFPLSMLRICSFPASIFMVLAFPLTFVFLKISQFISRSSSFGLFVEPQGDAQQEIIELIEESNLTQNLDMHDKKLIASVMEFKDSIAREIMVPRVDVFSLPHTTTIEEAAAVLLNEGYSRTPVYKENLDNIIGVLMYKDVLAKYMEYVKEKDSKILETPIESLVKNVLYTPETKKISQLLQDFRKKQVHLAIIVDEYGGTEGIVTIEDILEEIVGDIADEYDQEEILFVPLPEGGWLVDARMNISDIEEEFGIEIPQMGDYDTIGGYLFNETGTIPSKGFMIKQPNFELEVLRSNDRRVEKVRILPIISDEDDSFMQSEQ